MRARLAWLRVGVAALSLGWAGSGFARPADAPLEERGRQVYEANCAACHGTRGDGRGMAAHMFRTQPRDLRTGSYKFRSTPSGALPTDEDLLRTLTQGVRTTAMIPQTHIPEDDRKAVVAYIKTFSPRFSEEAPDAPITIPPPLGPSGELVRKGRQVYDAAQCWECHGKSGRGDGPSARQLKDDWGLPTRPTDLSRRPRKSGQTPPDLYRTIATGMNGTPMPSYSDSLSPEEIWSLVAYLESLPRQSEAKNLFRAVGEEQGGIMVERMHGKLGDRNPFGP